MEVSSKKKVNTDITAAIVSLPVQIIIGLDLFFCLPGRAFNLGRIVGVAMQAD